MLTTRVVAVVATVALAGAVVAGCGSDTPPPAAPVQPPATTGSTAAAGASPTTTAPLASVHQVPPERQDSTFATALARRHLTVADDSGQTAQFGRTVCTHLDADEPILQLAGEVQSSAQIDPDSAGYVIGAAAAVYCPANLSKIPSG